MASTRVTGPGQLPGTGPLGVPLQPGPFTPGQPPADRAATPQGTELPLGRWTDDLDAPAGVPVLWRWTASAGRVDCSVRLRAALDLPPAGEPGLADVRRLVHPDDLERFDDLALTLAAGAGAVQGTVRFVLPGGEQRSLHAWAAVRSDAGGVAGAFGGLLDVSGEGAALGALHRSLAALHAAEELTGVGLWEWDRATGELLWTAPMYSLVGVAPGAVHPTPALWHDAVHPLDRERARRLDEGALGRSEGHTETLRVIGADGALRYVRCWSAPQRDAGGTRVLGAAVEVSRQVRDRVRLERLSATDAVTGLLNRDGLRQRMEHVLAGAAGDVALILLDLDRFKAVNDALGHHVGDALLQEVSRRLGGVAPCGTLLARMGGDEFALVPPPGTRRDAVHALAAAAVAALRAPYLPPGSAEPVSCPASAGVAARPGSCASVEELLAEADLALYQAKDRGGDRYAVFDDALRSRARARHLAECRLRSGLDDGRLLLHYQPVVDLRTGRLVGTEALVRLREGTGPLLLPDAFIDVAEDTGLVVELDCWVVDQALDRLDRWRTQVGGDRVPWLAVNVSARSMEAPGVVRRILDGLADRELPAGLLKVELTERSFLGADPAGEAALAELIGSGVPVGIDDFGTGYSALAYLQRYDLDFMKIDRSFVEAVGREGRADAVVTAIVDLAHAHGMRVTAEGIENSLQAGRLAQIGCDLAQGYHFGRPAPAARVVLP